MALDTRSPLQSDLKFNSLLADIQGRVIRPGEEDYDRTRAANLGGVDRHPAAVVFPLDAEDVVRAVGAARELGLELAVRSGGHSGACHSTTEGGLLLDLSSLRDLQIDTQRRTIRAGSGLRAGDVVSALAEHGLVLPLGDTASVGLGGLTLGGGIGYLVRKFGLTIDDLLAAEIVTADGARLEVSDRKNPDLFWGIRGGGGNFGVVTSFLFRVHPLDEVYGGMIVLPATPETLTGFIQAAQAASEDLSAIINVMPAPPMPFLPEEAHGKMVIMATMIYAGEVEDGEQAVAPFRALAAPYADMLRPMRYHEIYSVEDSAGGGAPPCVAMRPLFLDSFDRDDAALILEGLTSAEGTFMTAAQLRVLGGAMGRVPVEATAFAHRNAGILLQLVALYGDPADTPRQEAWVAGFAASLRQENTGAYVNFLGPGGEAEARAAYPGATWDRLQAVKKRYDPDNLFRLNHNIPPG